jgi:hypothetical protein
VRAKTLSSKPAHSLRSRWRFYMILGLNLLIVIVVGTATLLTFIVQRQTALRLHESTARQMRAAIQQSLDNTQQSLVFAGQTIQDEADLERLRDTYPAVQAASLIDADGNEIAQVGEVQPDWTSEPAIQFDPLRITVPAASGTLAAWIDPQIFWADILKPDMGREGYVYLRQGDQMIIDPDH